MTQELQAEIVNVVKNIAANELSRYVQQQAFNDYVAYNITPLLKKFELLAVDFNDRLTKLENKKTKEK